ncbi:glycoside hydrolase family 20 protein [Rhizophagus clarus]|uniref:Glycoside hydrolase family 20 protein n=1 Tax=Rhizophagus clarus TaxID=94130 RepID=A0A8H3L320_9GLOM|nr:glycoside hydrolase family 20 protein [Rhizophagus clarus]
MILEGYGIEILVNNNIPLREYSEPYETSKEQITTKPSLIHDVKTNKCYESDRTVFVAVPKPGMEFTIKLWADSAKRKTYRAHVYIDDDKKQYNFLFASSLWTDDDSKVNLKEDNIHGFASISVEFFEAEWTLKENENPSYTATNDSNDSNYLPYNTRFEESTLSEEESPLINGVENHKSTTGVGTYYGWKSADKPSAVLTVHYRPKAWLKSRGLTPDPIYSRLSPEPLSESEISENEDEIERGREQLRGRRSRKYINVDEESSNLKRKRDKLEKKNNHRNKCNGKRADNSRKDRKVSNTQNVKFARYFEEIIEETKFIDIEASSNNPTEEIRRNKKLREIIEILDSDDDD